MSTWTTPATWVNGAVTAAQMNTEGRDPHNWLKGAIDLITGSTASDVGTGTRLAIIRTNATDDILQGKVSGDANQRFTVDADGAHDWGPGSAGTDVRLRRSVGGGGILVDNGSGGNAAIQAVGAVTADWGDATNEMTMGTGYIAMLKRTNPAAPSAGARLYLRDNGSGKAQLCIIANTGGAVAIWTQP